MQTRLESSKTAINEAIESLYEHCPVTQLSNHEKIKIPGLVHQLYSSQSGLDFVAIDLSYSCVQWSRTL